MSIAKEIFATGRSARERARQLVLKNPIAREDGITSALMLLLGAGAVGGAAYYVVTKKTAATAAATTAPVNVVTTVPSVTAVQNLSGGVQAPLIVRSRTSIPPGPQIVLSLSTTAPVPVTLPKGQWLNFILPTGGKWVGMFYGNTANTATTQAYAPGADTASPISLPASLLVNVNLIEVAWTNPGSTANEHAYYTPILS